MAKKLTKRIPERYGEKDKKPFTIFREEPWSIVALFRSA
jgi:hypothetical protein